MKKRLPKSFFALLSAVLMLSVTPLTAANASGGLIDGTVHVNVSLDTDSWVFGTSSTASHVNWNVTLTDESGVEVSTFGPEYSVAVKLIYRGSALCDPGMRNEIPFAIGNYSIEPEVTITDNSSGSVETYVGGDGATIDGFVIDAPSKTFSITKHPSVATTRNVNIDFGQSLPAEIVTISGVPLGFAIDYVLYFSNNELEPTTQTPTNPGTYTMAPHLSFIYDGTQVNSWSCNFEDTSPGTLTIGPRPNIPTTECAVRYWANFGTETVPFSTGSYVFGSRLTSLPNPDPTQPGFRFVGWFSASTNGPGVFQVGVDYPPTVCGLDLYAHWEPVNNGGGGNGGGVCVTQPAIVFDFQGGIDDPINQRTSVSVPFAEGSTTPIAVPGNPTKANFTFVNWQNVPNGSNVTQTWDPAPLGLVIPSGCGFTVYANWNSNPTTTYCNFVIDPQNSTPAYISTQYVLGSNAPISLPLAQPTNPGYSFTGWYNAASGGTKLNGSVIPSGCPYFVYAQWKYETSEVSPSTPTPTPTPTPTVEQTATTVTLACGAPVTLTLAELVGNSGAKSITITEQPKDGTLVDNGNGTFTYTPSAGLCNSGKVDGFTYTYTDASGKIFLVRKNFGFVKEGDVPKAVKTGGYFDIPGSSSNSGLMSVFFISLIVAAGAQLRRLRRATSK